MEDNIQSPKPEADEEYVWYKFDNIIAMYTDVVEAVIFAVVFAILLLTLIFRMGYVQGTSMLNTMFEGDRYILSDMFYTPKQGDIVVFAPDSTIRSSEPLWVKRVIALEGQQVYINPEDNCVYVDNVKLDETYAATMTIARSTPNPIVVPEGYVYLMGDNRKDSKDSRDIGCVDKRRIIGHVLIRVYPKFGIVK